MILHFIKDEFHSYIPGSCLRGALRSCIPASSLRGALRPYIPASSLRDKLRQALTNLKDKLALFELKNDSKVFLSSPTGSGNSCFFGSAVIACFLLREWKYTFQKFWTMLPNQKIASRPVFEIFKEEATSYTSTHIAYPELNLEINSLIFAEDNLQMQTLTQCSERPNSREADKSYLSSFLLFTHAPVQYFLHKCKQTSEEWELFSIQEINQELNNRKNVKNVGLQNYHSIFLGHFNPLKGIKTSKMFQSYPVFHKELLFLYFFIYLFPARGLKLLFASNNHQFRFVQRWFGFFDNSGLRLNKVPIIDYLKLIKLSIFRGQSEKINLIGNVRKYLTLLKEESRQLLKNQSNLLGLAKINIRRFVGNLLLISKLLFRRFLINKRCDFIFLVEMPP